MIKTEDRLTEVIARVPAPAAWTPEHTDDALLIAYREGRLAPAVRENAERHLAACSECRALLAELAAPVPPHLEDFGVASLRAARLRRVRIRRVASGLAIAAAILFAIIMLPPERAVTVDYDVGGPHGGVARLRGAGGEPSKLFVPSSTLELILTPRAPVTGEVELHVFVLAPEGRWIEAPASGITRGEAGTFRYELEAARLFGTTFGRRTLGVAITAPDQDPLAHLGHTIDVHYLEAEVLQ